MSKQVFNEQFAEELYNNTDTVACLDAVREAGEAVDIINKDMFSAIADICRRYTSLVSDNPEEVKSMLKVFEKKYKREKNIKTMPGSYRSAKSVIVNVLKNNINLHYGDGSIKTKTWLERELRQAKTTAVKKKADTPNTVVYNARRDLEALIAQTEDNKTTGLAANLSLIEDLCQQIREKYL